ncbi:MAG: hypothetical protein F6K39_07865 [Okeania sp. SIO3B3]|nr:hypothetical protein [Okeania sp. SIO3B3]
MLRKQHFSTSAVSFGWKAEHSGTERDEQPLLKLNNLLEVGDEQPKLSDTIIYALPF